MFPHASVVCRISILKGESRKLFLFPCHKQVLCLQTTHISCSSYLKFLLVCLKITEAQYNFESRRNLVLQTHLRRALGKWVSNASARIEGLHLPMESAQADRGLNCLLFPNILQVQRPFYL